MQTVIIISVLILSAVVSVVLLYAILRDHSENIAEGTEVFDGLPGRPQNLQVAVLPSSSENVDVVVSWDAPSYLSDNEFAGYRVAVQDDEWQDGQTDNTSRVEADGSTSKCVKRLNAQLPNGDPNPDFSYSNSCRWQGYPVTVGSRYVLDFRIERIDLPEVRYPPQAIDVAAITKASNIQVIGTERAVVVSWTGRDATAVYRFRTKTSSASDGYYYLCVDPPEAPGDSGPYTYNWELPDRAGSPGLKYQTPDEAAHPWPQPREVYELELASTTTASIDTETQCKNSFDTAGAAVFEGSYGSPAVPEFTVASVAAEGLTQPQVTIEPSSCNSDDAAEFTFYWSRTDVPSSPQQFTFRGCRSKILPIDTRPGAASGSGAFQIWATASNDFGTSRASAAATWTATPESNQPPAPGEPVVLWSLTPGPSATGGYHYQATLQWEQVQADGYNVKLSLLEPGAAARAGGSHSYSFAALTGRDVDCAEALMNTNPTYVASHTTELSAATASTPAPLTAFQPRSAVLCAELSAVAQGVSGPAVAIQSASPKVALSYANPQGDKVAVSWQYNAPADVVYYTAALSKAPGCPSAQTLLSNIVPAGSNSVLAHVMPLTLYQFPDPDPPNSISKIDDYICLTAHHANGSRHTFYSSPALAPMPVIDAAATLTLTETTDPADYILFSYRDATPRLAGYNLAGSFKRRNSENTASFSAIHFFLCLRWVARNSTEGHAGFNSTEFAGEEIVLGNQGVTIPRGATTPNVFFGPNFAWDIVFWDVDNLGDITPYNILDPSRTFDLDVALELWTSGDSRCPDPGLSENVVTSNIPIAARSS